MMYVGYCQLRVVYRMVCVGCRMLCVGDIYDVTGACLLNGYLAYTLDLRLHLRSFAARTNTNTIICNLTSPSSSVYDSARLLRSDVWKGADINRLGYDTK